MIISQNVDANTLFMYTIGSDNKKVEIVPANKVLFSSHANTRELNRYDFSNLPRDDPAALAAIAAEEEKKVNRMPSNLRPLRSRAFTNSINRPRGIQTTNPLAARRRRQRAEAAPTSGRRSNGLDEETISNVPTVRMIDRRLPTIATGTRGPQLFPAGTRTSNSWNQEEPGRPTRRLTASQRDRTIERAVELNRARLLNNINSNNRLRVAPKRKKRTKLQERSTFTNFM